MNIYLISLRYVPVMLSLVFCVTAQAKPFFSRDSLPFTITDVGGCKIISVTKYKSPSQDLLNWCRTIPRAPNKGDQSWHDYYSSLEYDLGSAFMIAERSLGGSRFSITGERAVHIVIYHEPYAQVTVLAAPNELVISLNDGVIDLVEDTVSGIELEFSALSGLQIPGVTFSDWLELMRKPCENNTKLSYKAGPDQTQPGNFWPTWYAKTRIKASMIYQFLFAHELAHIQRGDSLHEIKIDPLGVEIDCDKRAFKAFARNGDSDQAVFVVVPFLVGMWYHEKYWSEEISRSGRPIFQGSHPAFFTRNWKKRAETILSQWENEGSFAEKRQKIEPVRQFRNYISLRTPASQKDLNIQVLNDVEIKTIGIKFNKPPNDPKVEYGFVVVNQGKRTIEVTLEVQSRYFARNDPKVLSPRVPRDDKDRRYFVYRINTHSLRISPGKGRFVAGELDWIGTSAVYPGIDKRIVTARYLD